MAALNSTPCTFSPAPFPFAMGEAAFFYVDGIPTKGAWVPLDDVESWADIDSALCAAGYDAQGGDILCATTDGVLAGCCDTAHGGFDLDMFTSLRDDVARLGLNPEAVAAFIGWQGLWDCRAFENAYMGEYDSEEAFAEQYIDDTGLLSEVPDQLQAYFDVERFAHDLFMGDYSFEGGFVFCCNY